LAFVVTQIADQISLAGIIFFAGVSFRAYNGWGIAYKRTLLADQIALTLIVFITRLSLFTNWRREERATRARQKKANTHKYLRQ